MIAPPDDAVDPRLAAFSGVWEGSWDGTNPARMAVTRVGTDGAAITYAYAGDQRIATRPATLSPDGVLEWRYSDAPNAGRYSFTVAADGQSIDGTWDFGGQVRAISMTRCSPTVTSLPQGPAPASKPVSRSFSPPNSSPCVLNDTYPPAGANGQRFRQMLQMPAAGVSDRLVAFLGAWEGAIPQATNPDVVTQARLVVLSITPSEARIHQVEDGLPPGASGQRFRTAQVGPEGTLTFSLGPTGTEFRHTVAMLDDLNSVSVTVESDFGVSQATFTRCTVD